MPGPSLRMRKKLEYPPPPPPPGLHSLLNIMSLVADSKKKKDGKNRTGRKIVIEKIIERKERLQPDFQIFIGWSDQSGYSRPNCLWVPGVGGGGVL